MKCIQTLYNFASNNIDTTVVYHYSLQLHCIHIQSCQNFGVPENQISLNFGVPDNQGSVFL